MAKLIVSDWANLRGTLLFVMEQKIEKTPEEIIQEAEIIAEKARHMAKSEKIIAAQAYRMSTNLFAHVHDATTPIVPKEFELIHIQEPQTSKNVESEEESVESDATEEALSGEESQGEVAQSDEAETSEDEGEAISQEEEDNDDEDSDDEEEGENEQSDASSQEADQEDSTDDEEAQLIQPPKKRAKPITANQMFA